MRLLVTGGMGFIGSNFIHHMLVSEDDIVITNLDRLSCGSNPANLNDVPPGKAYGFVKGDINDFNLIKKLAGKVEAIANFAAETHVDRSISNPTSFHEANTRGVLNLLEACRQRDIVFLQVSTDEVYGSATAEQAFSEEDRLNPSSPYAASKAAADFFVNAYHKTYGLKTFITRSTNNFGPYQFPEKFIPKITLSAILGLAVPVYGSGRQLRDWLFVGDHCEAVRQVLSKGRPGETYNIAGGNQVENLRIVEMVLDFVGKPRCPVEHVEDRPGHDFSYNLNASKITRELCWRPGRTLVDALKQTVKWYMENESWWRPLIDEKILSPKPWKEKW